ncbi:MAG: hypothetical protein NUW37_03560 [Planctomycetes bacterium]|nr:hypothetical protein [Planctomycetota bacterium]
MLDVITCGEFEPVHKKQPESGCHYLDESSGYCEISLRHCPFFSE